MAKQWSWMVLAFAAGAVVIGSMWPRSRTLPTVRFADGKASQVVKVTFGTNHVFVAEPFWKQALRKVLPESMEKPLGRQRRYQASTPHDSLAVFIKSAPPDLVTGVQAIFPDGTAYQARGAWASLAPIVFTSYPREEMEVRLRFWDKQKGSVEVKVPNPRRARRAAWAARPLPQTNYVCGTEVVLKRWGFWKGYESGELFFSTRSLNGGPTGWMRWRTTLFDPWGNWHGGEYSRSPALPGAKSSKQYRVLAEGHEYISAGFVVAPLDREYFVLPLNQRATNWGVELLALFGRGSYDLSKALAIHSSRPTLPQTNAVRTAGSSWLVECAQPALLSIGTQLVSELRIRERLPYGAGRVFSGSGAGTAGDELTVAQLFTPRLPLVTTNLEAEVVVRWPAVEFFVEKSLD